MENAISNAVTSEIARLLIARDVKFETGSVRGEPGVGSLALAERDLYDQLRIHLYDFAPLANIWVYITIDELRAAVTVALSRVTSILVFTLAEDVIPFADPKCFEKIIEATCSKHLVNRFIDEYSTAVDRITKSEAALLSAIEKHDEEKRGFDCGP